VHREDLECLFLLSGINISLELINFILLYDNGKEEAKEKAQEK